MSGRDFKLAIIQDHQRDYCQKNAPLKICHSKLSVLTTQVQHYVKQKWGKKLKYTYYYLHAVLPELPTKLIYTGIYNGFETINCEER